MENTVLDPNMAEALVLLQAAIDAVDAAGFTVSGSGDAAALVAGLETQVRRLQALQVQAIDAIDRSGVARDDGYRSAKSMVQDVAGLSAAEAANRQRLMRLCRDLPQVATAWRSGRIGTCQARLLGRVHANPRVRDRMADRESELIRLACSEPYRRFDIEVREWERIADSDGSPPADRAAEARDAKLLQDFDGGWNLEGHFGSLSGAVMREIFDHYIDAEWRSDWEKARVTWGDQATPSRLGRTDAQRRADALFAIFQDAATNETSPVPPRFCHVVQWSAESYAEMLNRLCGAQEQPLDPATHLCQTLDGHPVDPTEAAVNSLWHQIRRAVVDTDGVVIDLGRARLFTGNARLAAQLAQTSCVWPGCEVPASRCEIDHITPHSAGGATNPANAALLCGRHKRWKQKGFRVWRDPAGVFHTYRPDGTEVGRPP